MLDHHFPFRKSIATEPEWVFGEYTTVGGKLGNDLDCRGAAKRWKFNDLKP